MNQLNVQKPSGFTLIEMIVVIVLTGIIAGTLATLIRRPVESYMDVSRRAQLVDSAELALQLISRDIHRALPNSVRITGSNVIEMIRTVDGARYRASPPPGNIDNRLQFNTVDTQFNTISQFQNLTLPINGSTTYRLVIYNLGTTGFDAYSGSNVITPSGAPISIAADTTVTNEDHITISGGMKFAHPSPRQRIFVIDTPITYRCAAGNLYRNINYPLSATQSTTPGGTQELVTNHVDCTNTNFKFIPGTSQRADLVTLQISLSDSGDTVTLLHQVHLDNLP